ncbi:hypothetical protein Tco_0951667 [Tanacetum coccineum]|uniref:Uncharacterized protein n=1 Tax=Tanacetum coccineum TaxID=301880 RepID=A0ABQ5DVJ4_9ASTR
MEVQILNKLRLERLFQALWTHDLRDMLKVMRRYNLENNQEAKELYAGYRLRRSLGPDLVEEILMELVVDSSRAKPSERIGTLMEPNGDIRHHFRKGGQSKWLTPRVEGNEVGNSEEIVVFESMDVEPLMLG